MPLDKMDKWRCSLNQYRYIQVDMCNEEQSAIISKSGGLQNMSGGLDGGAASHQQHLNPESQMHQLLDDLTEPAPKPQNKAAPAG